MAVFESVEVEIDLFVSSVGFCNIINLDHLEKMNTNLILSTFGHCNNEIDMSGLKGLDSTHVDNIKIESGSFRFLQWRLDRVRRMCRPLSALCLRSWLLFSQLATSTWR